MTYNEEHVAAMALTNILTSLSILTTLNCVNKSVYLSAHIVLIENSIGSLAYNLTDSEDGGIGSNMVRTAQKLVENVASWDTDSETIRGNALRSLNALNGKLITEEFKTKQENQELTN